MTIRRMELGIRAANEPLQHITVLWEGPRGLLRAFSGPSRALSGPSRVFSGLLGLSRTIFGFLELSRAFPSLLYAFFEHSGAFSGPPTKIHWQLYWVLLEKWRESDALQWARISRENNGEVLRAGKSSHAALSQKDAEEEDSRGVWTSEREKSRFLSCLRCRKRQKKKYIVGPGGLKRGVKKL